MIALYMPMQPSSKMPMMALSSLSWSARARPSSTSAVLGRAGSGRTWLASCSMRPDSIQAAMPSRNQESVPSTVHSEEYSRFIFVSPPLRFSRPTRPGHSGAKFAIVRTGPRWVRSPASTWWLYCQFAVATISGASGGICLNTSMPIRWERMKP